MARIAADRGECDDAMSATIRFVRNGEVVVRALLEKTKSCFESGLAVSSEVAVEDRHSVEIALCWSGVDFEVRLGYGQLGRAHQSVLEEWISLVDSGCLDEVSPDGECVVGYESSVWDYLAWEARER
ncbi:MAG: hypothetical protein GY716_06750 [bacterium]|nr:hypothetical protein [bacterium]